MAETRHFSLADYLLFSVTIVISISVGIYYAVTGGRQRTTSEFMVAGRSMSFLPVAISLFISFESSIMMLGLPAEGYMFGLQIFMEFFPHLIVNMLCAWIAVPLMYPLKITSSYQYLELRFNSRFVRRVGSLMDIVYNLWYIGIVLFGPAVALQAVTDFPLWMSIGGMALVAIIYTSIGGLKAVIWTDVFQAVVMFMGMFAVLVMGTIKVGGPNAVWERAENGGRMVFYDFSLDPRVRHTVWNLLLASTSMGFTLAFKQSSVQRLSSTNSIGAAKKIFLFVGPASFLVSVLSLYQGIVSYSYFDKKGCDPFESGRLTNPNQVVPYIVMDMFQQYTGMPGLFLASLFSASLSTLSSCLSSLSALIWTDFVHPAVGDIAEWKATLIAKIIVVVSGLVGCGLAWLISLVGGTLHQLSNIFMGALIAPLTGLFLLGCFSPRSTAKGVSIGSIISVVVTVWLSSGMSFTPGLHKNTYLPPASTEKCDLSDTVYNNTARWTTSGNESWVAIANGSMVSVFDVLATPQTSDVNSTTSRAPEGIEHLYTISYRWIAPMGVILCIVFGYIFSIITGPNKPGDVDPRYILPVSDSLFVWLPKRIRRLMSSQGTQFISKTSTNRDNAEMEVKPLVLGPNQKNGHRINGHEKTSWDTVAML